MGFQSYFAIPGVRVIGDYSRWSTTSWTGSVRFFMVFGQQLLLWWHLVLRWIPKRSNGRTPIPGFPSLKSRCNSYHPSHGGMVGHEALQPEMACFQRTGFLLRISRPCGLPPKTSGREEVLSAPRKYKAPAAMVCPGNVRTGQRGIVCR